MIRNINDFKYYTEKWRGHIAGKSSSLRFVLIFVPEAARRGWLQTCRQSTNKEYLDQRACFGSTTTTSPGSKLANKHPAPDIKAVNHRLLEDLFHAIMFDKLALLDAKDACRGALVAPAVRPTAEQPRLKTDLRHCDSQSCGPLHLGEARCGPEGGRWFDPLKRSLASGHRRFFHRRPGTRLPSK